MENRYVESNLGVGLKTEGPEKTGNVPEGDCGTSGTRTQGAGHGRVADCRAVTPQWGGVPPGFCLFSVLGRPARNLFDRNPPPLNLQPRIWPDLVAGSGRE